MWINICKEYIRDKELKDDFEKIFFNILSNIKGLDEWELILLSHFIRNYSMVIINKFIIYLIKQNELTEIEKEKKCEEISEIYNKTIELFNKILDNPETTKDLLWVYDNHFDNVTKDFIGKNF